MSQTIKLTAKRRATFPAELCEQLGLRPGDEIDLLPRVENGQRLWALRKRAIPARPWLGSLSGYAATTEDHSMDAIRESVARGRASGQ